MAHAEALVADPVALDEVVGATGARRRERADQDGDVDLARERAEARDDLGGIAVGGAGHRCDERDRDEQQQRPHLQELQPLHGLVDDRRGGESEPDRQQRRNGDRVCVTASKREGRNCGRARRPAGPRRREQSHQDEDQPERLPQPLEAGDRGLSRGERVALDLHVDEELHEDPDDRRPEEDQAGLRRDVGKEDVLPARDPHADQDHARADQLAQPGGLGQVSHDLLICGRRRRLRHRPFLKGASMLIGLSPPSLGVCADWAAIRTGELAAP